MCKICKPVKVKVDFYKKTKNENENPATLASAGPSQKVFVTVM
jgi:hypothetical protein